MKMAAIVLRASACMQRLVIIIVSKQTEKRKHTSGGSDHAVCA